MSDYHLHLHPHADLPGAPPPGVYPDGYIDRYVEVAAARGVAELGFTEHLYRCVESEAVFGNWWESDRSLPAQVLSEMERVVRAERNLSLERYVEVVLEAKARGLPVKLGLEVDFEPGTEQAVLDLIAPYPWDFLVGSVHWIGGWDFTRPQGPTEFARRGVERAWREYFGLETELAAAHMVDVLAHADVIKKAGYRPPAGLLADLYAPVVAAAAASGVAVEVSSAGLRRESKEIFPAPSFLAMFRGAGVPITLASDGHMAEDAAWGHDLVVAAARACGYDTYLRFDRRRAIVTALPTAMAGAADGPFDPGLDQSLA
ncbi:MAG TPA: PHP domain-containing protein [Candidatus Limnocylindrales bacterium]